MKDTNKFEFKTQGDAALLPIGSGQLTSIKYNNL